MGCRTIALFPNSVITVFPIYDEYIPHRNILQRCIRENEYGIIKSSFIEYMLQADRGTHTPSFLKDGRKPMQGKNRSTREKPNRRASPMMLGEISIHDANAMSAPMMHAGRTVCIRLTPGWAGGIKRKFSELESATAVRQHVSTCAIEHAIRSSGS